MGTSKCMKFRRISETVLLVFTLTLLGVDTTPALSTETTAAPSTTESSEDNTDNTTSSTSSNSSEKGRSYYSGDAYLDGAYKDCLIAKDMSTCVKYRALRYIHEMTSPFEETGLRGIVGHSEFSLGGPLKLVSLPPHDISTTVQPLFSESKPRSTDSEFMKLFRFTLREMERFVRSYALTVNVPMALSSGRSADDVGSPRFIDDDFFSGTLKEVASRDKKKTLLFLLPLISFFHLKALLVPILLAVLFIKKLLVLGVIFLPSLLSLVKWCKPLHHHHVPWIPESEPPIDYHSEYAPHYEHYKSRHTGHADRTVAPGGDHRAGPFPNRATWSGSKHFPEGPKNTWDNARHESVAASDGPKQGWADSNLSPAIMVTPSVATEVTAGSRAGSTYGIDEIRGNWGSSKRRNSVVHHSRQEQSRRKLYDEAEDGSRSSTWGSAQREGEDGSNDSYKGSLMTRNWDGESPPANQETRRVWGPDVVTDVPLRQGWRQDQPEEVGRGWNKDPKPEDLLRNQYPWSIQQQSFRSEKPRSGWGTEQEESSVRDSLENKSIWPDIRNSKKIEPSGAPEEGRINETVTTTQGSSKEKAKSVDSRSSVPDVQLHSHGHHPRGEKRKKCDHDSANSTSDSESEKVKEISITKPEISSNYSVLKNHRL